MQLKERKTCGQGKCGWEPRRERAWRHNSCLDPPYLSGSNGDQDRFVHQQGCLHNAPASCEVASGRVVR